MENSLTIQHNNGNPQPSIRGWLKAMGITEEVVNEIIPNILFQLKNFEKSTIMFVLPNIQTIGHGVHFENNAIVLTGEWVGNATTVSGQLQQQFLNLPWYSVRNGLIGALKQTPFRESEQGQLVDEMESLWREKQQFAERVGQVKLEMNPERTTITLNGSGKSFEVDLP